jgi:hypothetical protein
MTTGALLDRLRRHYIKRQDMPGGVFVEEVGLNGHTDRRCDAIYVGFTRISGQTLIGHEVKTRRSDWLRELDQPEKSERWSSQCHAWYVVAPDASVVPVEEVPDHWGLMYPDPKAKVRMQIVRRAQLYPERVPSWLVVRSIMARLDTLQRSTVDQALRQAEFDRQKSIDAEVRKQVEKQSRRDPERHNTELVEQLEEATGLDLRGGDWRDSFATPEQLAAALSIVKHIDALLRYQALAGYGRQIRTVADRFDELQTLVEKARTVIGDDQPSLLDDDR